MAFNPLDPIRVFECLPFAESRPNCEYSPNGRIATCTYPALVLIPVQDDGDPGDKVHSAIVPGWSSATTNHSALPDGVTGNQGHDLDVADNVDRFVVFTGPAAGPVG
ncbi:hypothetical protein GCM10027280_15530 [Micromonospora polyrhachis]